MSRRRWREAACVLDEAEPPAGIVASLVAALREGAATPAVLSRRIGSSLPAIMAALVEAELDAGFAGFQATNTR